MPATKKDLLLDIVANRFIFDYTRALSPKGSYVAVGSKSSAPFLGSLISITGSKNVSQLSHKPNVKDLILMKELIEAGKVIPVIARRYPISEVAEAIRCYEEGNLPRKVVITVTHNNKT